LSKGFGVLLSILAFVIAFVLIVFLDGALLIFYSETLSINIYESSTFLPVIIIVNESVFGVVSIIFGALIFKGNIKREMGLFSSNLLADFKAGFLYGFIGWLLAASITALINYFFPIKVPKEFIEVLTPKSLSNLLLLVALSWIFIGPCEELLFRGLIQTAFAKWKGVFISILASAFIFSLAHLDLRFWVRSISTLILGLLYGWVYHRRKSLISVAAAHSLNDSLAFILAFITR